MKHTMFLVLVIAVLAVAISIIAIDSQQAPLAYNTGFTVDTETKGFVWDNNGQWTSANCVFGPNEDEDGNGPWNTYETSGEVNWFDQYGAAWWGKELVTGISDVVVTAWYPGVYGQSVPFTLQGRVCNPCTNNWGFREFGLSRYYYTIEKKEAGDSDWVKILARTPDEINGLWVDGSWIHIDSTNWLDNGIYTQIPKLFSGAGYHDKSGGLYDQGRANYLRSWFKETDSCAPGEWINGLGESLTIRIKGSHVGVLRIKFYAEVAHDESGAPGFDGECFPPGHAFQTDYLYMASGQGSIEVTDLAGIPEDLFEPGDTAVFELDTGYSGQTQGNSLGWQLGLWDQNGNEYTGQAQLPDGSYVNFPVSVGDNKVSYKVKWVIPTGAGNGMWTVKLINTLFQQDETWVFTIEDSATAPGKPSISFYDTSGQPKTEYAAGEIVVVRLSAQANPDGTGEITKFFVNAKYMGSSTYLYNPGFTLASPSSGLTYTGTFQFQNLVGDMVIEAYAVSVDSQNGYSGSTTATVYSNDDDPRTSSLTVYVRDKDTLMPISNAEVIVLGISSLSTGQDGTAIIGGLTDGYYDIIVQKEGYSKYTDKLHITDDTSALVLLGVGGDLLDLLLPILISIVIALLFIIPAIFLPTYPAIRVALVIIGIILAVVVYLFMSGIINIGFW